MPIARRRVNVCLAASALAIAWDAHAQTAPLSNLIGNTLKMTTRGSSVSYQFHADQTLTAVMPGGVHMQGSWRVSGETLCTRLGMQGFTGPEVCIPKVPANKRPGDSWDTSYNGMTTHGEIIQGQR